MTMQRAIYAGAVMIVLAAGGGTTSVAQVGVAGGSAATKPDWPARDMTATEGKLLISAQAMEKPDLTYALLPPISDLTTGNAAVKYMVAATNLPKLSDKEESQLQAALGARMDYVTAHRAEFERLLGRYADTLNFARAGARMDQIDWQTDFREKGMSTMLPWLSPMRQIGRAVTLGARVAIAKHDWKTARDYLQTGYALGRHLGKGETLIESLVGLVIVSNMNDCVADWIGEPGSPNLYWPLVNLPSPFNDLQSPLEFERSLLSFLMPEFREMEAGHYSADIWNRFVVQMSRTLASVRSGEPGTAPAAEELAGPALGMAMYPEAKRFLQARGMTAEQVEKMPVAEALGRYFVRSFDEQEDDVFKWAGLPAAQRLAGLREQEKHPTSGGNILANALLPSLSSALTNSSKVDRRIALLRIVEALRAYAAEKGTGGGARGTLPDMLEEIRLPLPQDPLGQMIRYTREEPGKRVLTIDAMEKTTGFRLEVELRK